MADQLPVRRILHCDMVVGGDPSGRGVVAAASYQARKFGIHSAMPAAQARRRCPETIFLRPDFTRYREESQQIFSIFRDYTPVIQPLSLDEAFLDVTEHLGRFGSGTAVAEDIRRRVWEERRLTISVGVAPNKLVAKIASDFRKPDGLTVVRPHEVVSFLAPLPVRRLYGVGPSAERSLHEMGITTVGELRTLSVDRLIACFGQWGRVLWERARGIDDRPVHTRRERKSLSTERTFAENVSKLDEIDRLLADMAAEVAGGLEKRRLSATTITVKVRYPDFLTPTRSQTLPVPTSDPATIAAVARELVRRTDAAKRSVRLLGVGASNLVPGELGQMALFED
jgi:DNA polymerase-4